MEPIGIFAGRMPAGVSGGPVGQTGDTRRFQYYFPGGGAIILLARPCERGRGLSERTNHRLQAIIKALKQRDKETIAIEARLRQTMIDRIGDPQGVPADDEPATPSSHSTRAGPAADSMTPQTWRGSPASGRS